MLVVVGIIGLLAAVVLGSLQKSRERGANAAVKQNMSSLRSEVELFYSNALNPTYTGVCGISMVLRIRAAADTASGGTTVCYSSANAWAASSPLKGPEGTFNYWCVDTSGTARGHANALPVNATVCPAS